MHQVYLSGDEKEEEKVVIYVLKIVMSYETWTLLQPKVKVGHYGNEMPENS